MRIALNGRFMARPFTGVDRYALETTVRLNAMLVKNGERLDIFLPHGAIVPPSIIARMAGAQFVYSKSISRSSIWEQLWLPWAARKHLLLSLCNIGPLLQRRQFVAIHDAQFITQPASYSWKFRSWYRLALWVLARVSCELLTVSNFSKIELESLGVAPRGKAVVVPNGLDHVHDIVPDLDVLDRHGLTAGSFLLMIGSRARHKNVGPVLAALRGKLPEGARIVLVGGGNARIFADEGIEPGDDVLMTGRVTDEELVALYQNARAFLFPSLTEGFGLPPAEAMALGCPVIATDRGAVPEVMGDACIYVDPSDGAAWVDAARRVWDDPALRADLTAKGLVRAQAWTWDRAADALRYQIDYATGIDRTNK